MQEPLDQAQIKQIREIPERPRDSPPPNDAEFELFGYDVERHGFVNALNLHIFGQPGVYAGYCKETDQEQERIEQDEGRDLWPK